jgi:hypothetical protein
MRLRLHLSIDHHARWTPARYGVLFIRYGLGWLLVVAGIVLLIVSPGGFGLEGFGMATGSGLSILLLNYLYRLGVAGDVEREREEQARVYLAEHGHWPDQRQPVKAAPAEEEPQAGREQRHRHRPPDVPTTRQAHTRRPGLQHDRSRNRRRGGV